MKKLTALFCLIILLTGTLTAQTSAQSVQNIRNAYGLESGRNYSSDEVAELLAIAEEETEISINKAYAEGYKAGVKEYAGENARLETLNKELQKEALKMEMQKQILPYITGGSLLLGLIGGFAARGALWK